MSLRPKYGRGRGKTNTPDKLWEEFLVTNTLEYWLDIFHRAVAYCNKEATRYINRGIAVPKELINRRAEYQALIDYADRGFL